MATIEAFKAAAAKTEGDMRGSKHDNHLLRDFSFLARFIPEHRTVKKPNAVTHEAVIGILKKYREAMRPTPIEPKASERHLHTDTTDSDLDEVYESCMDALEGHIMQTLEAAESASTAKESADTKTSVGAAAPAALLS